MTASRKQQQHAWWLDHYYLRDVPYEHASEILRTVTIAAPIPTNNPIPLALHCLIWPGPVNSYGYGMWKDGVLVHRAAYIVSRGKDVPKGAQVNHLCNRPYCWQPAHLYLGNAKDNAEDRDAYRAPWGSYKTVKALGDRHEWSGNATCLYHIEARPLPYKPQYLSGLELPGMPCPHTFDVPAGDAFVCSGCGLSSTQKARSPALKDLIHEHSCAEQGIPNACRCRCTCRECRSRN